jgi:ubiquinone/menaquinone biosynthesis C-methylase UbiE
MGSCDPYGSVNAALEDRAEEATMHRPDLATVSRFVPFAVLMSLIVTSLAAGDDPVAEPDLETLRASYREARENHDPATALEIAEETFWVTAPPHIETLYAIAATHAVMGHEDDAYEWLEKTLDAGFWDFRKLRTDDDFAAIRDQDRFVKLWRGAWSKQYIAMLERDEREDFQQPVRVMETLAFRPGERVADVGAGSGYFTVRVARAVGPEGSVVATDIRQEMIAHLQNRLEQEGIVNVRTVLAEKDDPGLPAGSVDTILMVDVWHYIRDPEFAVRLRTALAPGGRVVVIDYRPRPWDERPWGPPPEQQTPRDELDAHMAAAGLAPVRVHDWLSEQYFVEYAVP